ncbi:hypothetical protein NEFER01_1703 [Nematocida sp. LUAm1]|nr:hypothetical protein NEFER02_1548 [Nematocida sp. LUAm2]KAI5178567.1 hypothetical protein NEFER01_1703 [Nematocida sp. LUAm1]
MKKFPLEPRNKLIFVPKIPETQEIEEKLFHVPAEHLEEPVKEPSPPQKPLPHRKEPKKEAPALMGNQHEDKFTFRRAKETLFAEDLKNLLEAPRTSLDLTSSPTEISSILSGSEYLLQIPSIYPGEGETEVKASLRVYRDRCELLVIGREERDMPVEQFIFNVSLLSFNTVSEIFHLDKESSTCTVSGEITSKMICSFKEKKPIINH